MIRPSIKPLSLARAVTGILLLAGTAYGGEIKVMTSGAFTAAFRELIPEFERKTQNKVVIAYGVSAGKTPDAIPNRLQRGEPADVVIMGAGPLEELIKQGKVAPDSRVDLVQNSIGMAVRAGAAKPDISSVDALKRTLLQAKSVAYSSAASGIYLSTVLFPRLGIADQIMSKCKRIESGPVGAAVARGDAEIGFQRIWELLPVAGIDYAGPLPPEVQEVNIISAGVAVGAQAPDAARALIQFLVSPAAAAAITKSGLYPLSSH